MLVNLLARLEGTVERISLACPEAELVGRISPLSPSITTLKETLLSGAGQIDGVPLVDGDPLDTDILLSVGPGGLPSSGWRVFGEGFAGAISPSGITGRGTGSLPIGPYVAACLAAAEIFRFARLPKAGYHPTDSLSFSLLDYRLGDGGLDDPLVIPDRLALDFGLAGVGAVGCALLQTLWACPGLGGRAVIADSDEKGIDSTNLNRCAIFDRRHVGLPKATTAAGLLKDCDLQWEPVDGLYAPESIPRVPPTLLSAVDTNRSRISLQEGFWPGRLFGASTLDLRAEITRLGPPGGGPCLGCFNPAEPVIPDDVRRDALLRGGEEEMVAVAARIGCSVEEVRSWAEKGECGQIGAAALSYLQRSDEPEANFSVGFVSVFAGVALAAELLKETAGCPVPLNDEFGQAKFQFLNPSAEGNGDPLPVKRDPGCVHCDEDAIGREIWRQRAASWTSP
jgi:molybdopterin/thiamine biosynthesis adenylyltransferase